MEDDGGHDSEQQVISEESRCPIRCLSGLMMSSDYIMIDSDVTFPVFKTVKQTIREGRSNSMKKVVEEQGCQTQIHTGPKCQT